MSYKYPHIYLPTSSARTSRGRKFQRKTISQRKNLPIECAQGDRPARCPNHFFAVNEPSAVPWWWCDLFWCHEVACTICIYIWLVVSSPVEKYARQIGNPPQGPGMKIKNLWNHHLDMGVSKNNGTPKSSILIGFSIINHPFTPIFANIHINMHDLFDPKHLYPHGLLATWRHRSRLDLSNLGCLRG